MEKNRIGKQIKYWRQMRNMTQKELAQAIKGSATNGQVYIAMVESGKRIPTLEGTLPKICEALGLDFDVVLFDNGKLNPNP